MNESKKKTQLRELVEVMNEQFRSFVPTLQILWIMNEREVDHFQCIKVAQTYN